MVNQFVRVSKDDSVSVDDFLAEIKTHLLWDCGYLLAYEPPSKDVAHGHVHIYLETNKTQRAIRQRINTMKTVPPRKNCARCCVQTWNPKKLGQNYIMKGEKRGKLPRYEIHRIDTTVNDLWKMHNDYWDHQTKETRTQRKKTYWTQQRLVDEYVRAIKDAGVEVKGPIRDSPRSAFQAISLVDRNSTAKFSWKARARCAYHALREISLDSQPLDQVVEDETNVLMGYFDTFYASGW